MNSVVAPAAVAATATTVTTTTEQTFVGDYDDRKSLGSESQRNKSKTQGKDKWTFVMILRAKVNDKWCDYLPWESLMKKEVSRDSGEMTH
ncbi:hypothetical protein E3N88_11457 [Mikania micrantha]|uniref:Uncharacterized protein n=1 Tax=Mikania micrantha TaxID=192012 RepID=A0A5N6PGD4_9ASTR|nr:hypothetical protein E3N88_11457 [Mikania micrantha]